MYKIYKQLKYKIFIQIFLTLSICFDSAVHSVNFFPIFLFFFFSKYLLDICLQQAHSLTSRGHQ